MNAPKLSIRRLRTQAVKVPMTYALGTSATTVREAPLMLFDLETEEGITGHAYLFCYLPAAAPALASLAAEVERTVKGDRVAPIDLWAKLTKRFTLIGVHGIVRMATAALDVAAWDALAKAVGLPLVEYLGGTVQPIRAYNSCGLGLMAPDAVADEAEKLLANGFRAMKLRLGYPTLEADLAALYAVRKRVPEDIAIMVDFNQALTLAEALRRGRALDKEGVYWIEEPIRHDDYRGAAILTRELDTPIQIGENFSGARAMRDALDAQACDYVMPDVERIGGVTGWRHAAGIAAESGIEMSSHLFPEVSAHLLAVTPTRHWLEYMDWANAIVREPLAVVDGKAVIPDRPGNGLEWDADKVARYSME